MKKTFSLLSFLFALATFSAFAQENADKQNAAFRQVNVQSRANTYSSPKKIKSPVKMMKEADFTLYSFPGKNTNYISVKDAQPNSKVSVIAYDASGKLIFKKDVIANPYGQMIVNIDPMISYKPGNCFVAALYNNQAYFENFYLNK